MTWSLTLSTGGREVVLPNGLLYKGTFQVFLTDDWYSQLSAGAAPLISSASYLGARIAWKVTLASGLRAVALPNGLAYSGGDQVTLSDDQYSVIYPAVAAALFSSSVMEGGS